MKHLRKLVALLLCTLLLSANVSAFSIEADYKDVPKKHWAYEYVMRLGREGIMHGMVEGEYFNKNGEVRSKELLAVLHRMTGEEAYEELVPIDEEYDSIKDTWYENAVLWAVNNSIITFHYTAYSKVAPSSISCCGFWEERTDDRTAYNRYLRFLASHDSFVDNIVYVTGGANTAVTRSDVLVAFYRYTVKVLGREAVSNGNIANYTDCAKFPTSEQEHYDCLKLYQNSLNIYSDGYYDFIYLYGNDALTQIWLWAIDAGIIEGYPDNTLRPDATITRAEFAAMLTRFMDYVK